MLFITTTATQYTFARTPRNGIFLYLSILDEMLPFWTLPETQKWACWTESPFLPCLPIHAVLNFLKFTGRNKILPDMYFGPVDFRKSGEKKPKPKVNPRSHNHQTLMDGWMHGCMDVWTYTQVCSYMVKRPNRNEGSIEMKGA